MSISAGLVDLQGYLDGTITFVGDFDPDPFATTIDHDAFLLRNDCAWETVAMVQRGIWCWERVVRGSG